MAVRLHKDEDVRSKLDDDASQAAFRKVLEIHEAAGASEAEKAQRNRQIERVYAQLPNPTPVRRMVADEHRYNAILEKATPEEREYMLSDAGRSEFHTTQHRRRMEADSVRGWMRQETETTDMLVAAFLNPKGPEVRQVNTHFITGGLQSYSDFFAGIRFRDPDDVSSRPNDFIMDHTRTLLRRFPEGDFTVADIGCGGSLFLTDTLQRFMLGVESGELPQTDLDRLRLVGVTITNFPILERLRQERIAGGQYTDFLETVYGSTTRRLDPQLARRMPPFLDVKDPDTHERARQLIAAIDDHVTIHRTLVTHMTTIPDSSLQLAVSHYSATTTTQLVRTALDTIIRKLAPGAEAMLDLSPNQGQRGGYEGEAAYLLSHHFTPLQEYLEGLQEQGAIAIQTSNLTTPTREAGMDNRFVILEKK
ncbi:Uncharacterised protein [uncultured archaeon]|nr:Uncharacterised protein [uncultured archaeon]